MVEKALNDVKEWKAKEIKAKGEMWYKILIGAAIIVGLFVLWKIAVPSAPQVIQPQIIKDTAVQVITNATVIG